MVEDNNISSGVGRGVIGEEAAADVVQLQAFVSVKSIGDSKWPVPQQDGNISL